MLKKDKNILILVLLCVIIGFSGYYFWSSKAINSPVKVEQQPTGTKSKDAKPSKDSKPKASKAAPKQKDSSYKIEDTIIKNVSGSGLSRDVLHLALKAYYNAANDGEVNNHKLTIIDYSLPSNKKRMWLIDMDKKTVDLNTYVSHGAKSGDKIAKEFSNKIRSNKSSIGVMKTGKTYTGHKGLSLHLYGLEEDFNSNVYRRHVVIHGTQYVSDGIAKARVK